MNDDQRQFGWGFPLLVSLALWVGLLGVALAQTPNPVTPGYQVCRTTDPGNTQCSFQPVDLTHPLPTGLASLAGGVQVSLDGSLSVNTQAYPQFADTFSAALDTTTNWTLKASTGTAATSAGQLVVNSSTTASAWGGVSSQQSYAPVGVSPQLFGVLASFTVTTQANSVRVWGMFTVPATPTTAVPVTDGYIYRLDGTGALFAEVWSSGAAISSTNVTTACLPAAGFPAIFAINYRASLVQFICGTSTASPVAVALGLNPVQQVLPVSALSIAGSTPPGASAVMNLSAIALATLSPGTVKSANQAPTINDPYGVVGLSPNSAGLISTGTPGVPAVDTVVSVQGVTGGTPVTVQSASTGGGFPTVATPIAGNSTGTTGAVVGTLAAAAAKTTYLCDFDISALGTASSIGPIVVAGLLGGSKTYQMGTLATGTQQLISKNFNPCIPASAANTAITITTTADATATAVDVNSSGYQQ